MNNIPFPNPHDADSLNTYLDALNSGSRPQPESDVEAAAQEFHLLASRAGVMPPAQQSMEAEKGQQMMQTAAVAAPISNRTRRQMDSGRSGRSFVWLSMAIVAGLLISMIGTAWLNREPRNPNENLAWAPGTVEAETSACPVTLPNHVDAAPMQHYAADGRTWFEDGIWITIPTDGVLTIGPAQQNTDPESKEYGWGFEKLFVLRGEDVDGMVTITGRNLLVETDSTPYNDTRVDEFYGTTGFVPISLMIPGPGCWEFTATAGDSSATWVAEVQFGNQMAYPNATPMETPTPTHVPKGGDDRGNDGDKGPESNDGRIEPYDPEESPEPTHVPRGGDNQG